MFDVGFQELALIFGVSLLVLGPKRLPGLVSKVGRWVGKARVMARDFRQQLENEVNLEELNRMTEQKIRETLDGTPSPPASATPPQPESPPTYPYSAPDPAATDDTFSHAHAADDSPIAAVQVHADEAAAAPGETGETATSEEPALADNHPLHEDNPPMQADLDLSTPDDNSHLPPDDARRYT